MVALHLQPLLSPLCVIYVLLVRCGAAVMQILVAIVNGLVVLAVQTAFLLGLVTPLQWMRSLGL